MKRRNVARLSKRLAQEAKPAQVRELEEPDEKQRPLPWFVVMLIGAMTMWGMFYIHDMNFGLDSQYGDSRTPSALMPAGVSAQASEGGSTLAADGSQIFASKCATCHQANGAGVPGVFPPLAGSEWVLGSDKVLVQIPLHGVAGPLVVKGTTYNGAMPTFASFSDDEIAAVLTHVRSQWGNAAPAVSSATVKSGRAFTKARATPWASGEELAKGAEP